MRLDGLRTHRHFFDVIESIEVCKLVGKVVHRRFIRVRQCHCGEPGFEVPA